MKGTRPLSPDEVVTIANVFDGKYAIRDRSLFLLGVSTGGRISELLALTIVDVYQNDKPVTDLHFKKDIVKGKAHARAVPVNTDGIQAIKALIQWHQETYGSCDPHLSLIHISEPTRPY